MATFLTRQSIGIRVLKNRLSEFVRAAAAGETMLVTDRGSVVAELVPPRVPAQASQEVQQLGELIRQGLLAPAKSGPRSRLPPRRPTMKLGLLLRELDASRADR